MKSKTRISSGILIIPVLFAAMAAGIRADGIEDSVYILAKRIYTCGGQGTVENGGILIEKGRIIRVDRKAKAPKGIRILDLKDGILAPGLIDAQSTAGFREEDFRAATEPPPPWSGKIPARYRAMMGGMEPPPPAGAEVRYEAGQAVFFKDPAFRKLLAAGITTVKTAIPTDSLVGGLSACVKSGAGSEKAFLLRNPAAAEFSFDAGDRAFICYGDLKKMFLEAKEYRKSFVKYLEEAKAYADRKKPDASAGKAAKEGGEGGALSERPREPRRDENQEILLKILDGKIPVMIRASSINEIEAVLKIRDEFKAAAVIIGGRDARLVADKLVRSGIPVISGPEITKAEDGQRIPLIQGLMAKGVLTAYGSNSGTGGIFLSDRMAFAMDGGLTREQALSAVTSNAARILGIDDRVGILAPGKDADIIVLNGDPFDAATRILKVFVDGRIVYGDEK